MKSKDSRRTVAEFAVGLMVCGAVHMFLIAPAEDRSLRVQAEADALSHPQSSAPSLNADQLETLAQDSRATAARINELSAPAKDEADLFGRIMALAAAADVRVESLQPTGEAGSSVRRSAGLVETPAGFPPSAPGDTPSPPPADTSAGYSIVLSAPYVKVAEFLRQVPTAIGFAVVRAVKIESSDTAPPGWIKARVETEHFAFDVSQVIRLLRRPGATTAGAEETTIP